MGKVWKIRRLTAAELAAETIAQGEILLETTNNDVYIGTGSGNTQIVGGASGLESIDDITDVVITSVADGEILVWDSGTSKWINQTWAEIAGDHGNLSGLTDDDHTQYLLADGTRGLSANWDVGAHTITATRFISDIATGTAPLTVASTTLVDNLNADMVDGVEAAALIQSDGSVSMAADLSMGDNDLTDVLSVVFQAASELTIDASGDITVTQGVHTVDTNADAGSDELDTISGGTDGMFLLLRAAHTDRTVVIKDGVDNIACGGADVTLDATDQYVLFYYDGALTKWLVVGGTGSGGSGADTALSNLASVAINTSLVSDTDDTDDLGTSSIGWRHVYMSDGHSGAPTTNGQFGYNVDNNRFEFYQNGGVVAVGSGTKSAARICFPAGSFKYPTSNPAPLDMDSGTNGTVYRHLFDDTTEEFVEGDFIVPSDVDGSGTVTFRAYGYSVTAAASKNIELRLGHSARADAETWDNAYTDEDSGDEAVSSTQDQWDLIEWTETVANLAWAAKDHVRFQLSRIAPTANNLSGDWGLTHFEIVIPRT